MVFILASLTKVGALLSPIVRLCIFLLNLGVNQYLLFVEILYFKSISNIMFETCLLTSFIDFSPGLGFL